MTWEEFGDALREEGWTTDEIIEYVADLQEYPESVQRILLAPRC